MIHSFLYLLRAQENRLNSKLERFQNGVESIGLANEAIKQLQEELQVISPILEQSVLETASLSAKIKLDQEELIATKDVVATEESEFKLIFEQTEKLRDEALQALDQAMPAYKAAIRALKSLNKSDIIEIKSFLYPPKVVFNLFCV
jgi:dynein heavy chain